MKYVILIYSNPASREIWESFSAEEQAGGFEAYRGIAEELTASGELIATEALADASHTRRLPATEPGFGSGDGPYAEAKEQLAGFFLVDCADEARALEIAGRIPEAPLGLVEVRPVMDLSSFEQ